MPLNPSPPNKTSWRRPCPTVRSLGVLFDITTLLVACTNASVLVKNATGRHRTAGAVTGFIFGWGRPGEGAPFQGTPKLKTPRICPLTFLGWVKFRLNKKMFHLGPLIRPGGPWLVPQDPDPSPGLWFVLRALIRLHRVVIRPVSSDSSSGPLICPAGPYSVQRALNHPAAPRSVPRALIHPAGS